MTGFRRTCHVCGKKGVDVYYAVGYIVLPGGAEGMRVTQFAPSA
jgi:hypothetical protein